MSEPDDYSEITQFLAGALRRDQRRDQHREETNMANALIGHNRGGAALDFARDVFNALSAFLCEHPVIETPQDARDANEVFSSTQRSLGDLDAERKEQVDPLNDEVKLINAQYRAVREPIERSLEDLKRRLTNYVIEEERKRAAEAARLRAEAEAAARAAREAEAREADAIASVDTGVCEDVGDAIVKAEQAFGEFARADRAAATAEKNVTVKLHSRFDQRARSLRTSEVLTVVDAVAAVRAIYAFGDSAKINDAIVSEARAYRKGHGELPPGISVQYVRSM